jgi:predicted Rossmann fold nucleotide-binding protein DprA/Smf involved in DNA uptake
MTISNPTPDTQAILLLCGSLGRADASTVKPLDLCEFEVLAERLVLLDLAPADLLHSDSLRRLESSDPGAVSVQRLARLLERGKSLAAALEAWAERGIWVISRGDAGYPKTLRDRLGSLAPPLLHGSGDPELLSGGGLAILGSDRAEIAAVRFAARAARACTACEMQVVSGTGKGVEEAAVRAAIEAGGTVVAVSLDGLEQKAEAGPYRDALAGGRLTLVSPTAPEANTGTGTGAGGCHRCLYGLCERALVVDAGQEDGETFTGAAEDLERGWVSLFVRACGNAPEANRKLVELGGVPMGSDFAKSGWSIRHWLESAEAAAAAKRSRSGDGRSGAEKPGTGTGSFFGDGAEDCQNPFWEGEEEGDDGPQAGDLFEVVWPYLRRLLDRPKSEKEVAEALGILPSQAREWLKRAVAEKKADKLSKPVRYLRAGRQMRIVGKN